MPQGDALDALSDKQCRFLACRGVETEVRAVLRDILVHKRNLADCAVVYLGGEYPQLLYKMAPRFEIPLALESGIPLRESALFAALQGLQTWVQAQYPIELLYPLLINRDCNPKHASQLARVLAKRSVTCGKEGYMLTDTQRPDGIEDATWADWQAFLACVTALGDAFVVAHKNNLQNLLAHYMPLHRMGEDAAYHATLALLESAAQTCAEGEPLLARLLTLMQGGSYQPSTKAEPALLCMPVAKALLSGRKTLYVVDLTRYALEEGGDQSPILLDAECEAISLKLDTVANRATRLAAQFNRLIVTHQSQGELIFSYPNFESVHMTPVQPAPFYAYSLAQTIAAEEQVSYLAQTPLTAPTQRQSRPRAKSYLSSVQW